ncbi:MAG: hypothetical protein M1544_02695 [Candidatus Marsarchaeota archaeon]|nr:hypothetical protein [Candidatus Marsarchaeota archaeon]MCL5102238.1 hypothetical protein [Candidatus Marsarchaeota archaeon]
MVKKGSNVKVTIKEMLSEIERYNLDFLKYKLVSGKHNDTIKKLYDAIINDDPRITQYDDIYVLYTDIAKGDVDKFCKAVGPFLENKSFRALRHNDIEQLLEYLDGESEKPEHLGDIKQISRLMDTLAKADKEMVDNLERSNIVNLSDSEADTLRKYLRRGGIEQ